MTFINSMLQMSELQENVFRRLKKLLLALIKKSLSINGR